MKYIIEKEIKFDLEIEVFCRKCEEPMNNTANPTKGHMYFACPKCGNVIVINLKIKGDK